MLCLNLRAIAPIPDLRFSTIIAAIVFQTFGFAFDLVLSFEDSFRNMNFVCFAAELSQGNLQVEAPMNKGAQGNPPGNRH